MIRNAIATCGIYLVVASLGMACATPATERSGEPAQSAEKTEQTQAEAPSGPFEAAERWATEYDANSTTEPIADITADWQRAHVERVWAAGEQYRAIIVQKSTTGETPAVLLIIARSEDGRWQVVDATPATSTHLWSEL